MLFDIYTLPYLVISAGQESSFYFGLYDEDGDAVSDIACTCDVSEYCNEGAPLASWDVPLERDTGFGSSALHLSFPADQTLRLGGKYVYQLTMTLNDGSVAEIRKGILYVRRNIAASA